MLALRAQARPVALALLVVMTVTLAAVLEGHTVLWPFVAASALGYAGAAAYGQNTLHTTPAELVVSGPFATLRSVWDVAGGGTDRLAPVASARLVQGELTAGIGDDVVSFRSEDWSDFDAVVRALRGAAAEGRGLIDAMA